MKKAALFWLAGMFVCVNAWAQALVDVPPYAPVVDLTGTLTVAQRQALTHKLQAFERERGSELAVVLLPTTQPEPIEDYANRLANTWKLGRQGIGDGLVVVIAKNDRTSRIEVAKALEGAVPDLAAKRILRERMSPAFKQGAFYEGLDAGLDALFERIVEENLPAPPQPVAESPRPPEEGWVKALVMGMLVMSFVVTMAVPLLGIYLLWRLLRFLFGNKSASRRVGRWKTSPASSSPSRTFRDSSPAPTWSHSIGSSSTNSGWSGSSSSSDSSSSSSGGGDYGGGGASDRW